VSSRRLGGQYGGPVVIATLNTREIGFIARIDEVSVRYGGKHTRSNALLLAFADRMERFETALEQSPGHPTNESVRLPLRASRRMDNVPTHSRPYDLLAAILRIWLSSGPRYRLHA
jgi:hypothetical protein